MKILKFIASIHREAWQVLKDRCSELEVSVILIAMLDICIMLVLFAIVNLIIRGILL